METIEKGQELLSCLRFDLKFMTLSNVPPQQHLTKAYLMKY